MANPAIMNIGGYLGSIEAGTSVPILKAVAGAFSLLNGATWTPQNLVNCAVGSDGAIAKSGSTFAFDAGVTSVEAITSGEGLFQFVANVQPQATLNPTSDFGGKRKDVPGWSHDESDGVSSRGHRLRTPDV